MASLPKLEKLLFIISTGITGLEIYNEYGIVLTELKYFIGFCKEKQDLSVRAMGPSLLVQKYSQPIKESYDHVIGEMQDFDPEKSSKEKAKEILLELDNLHDLISRVYDLARATTMPF